MTEQDSLTPEEARVREAVRGLPPVRADERFRARLRDEFVSGGIAARPSYSAPARRRRRWLLRGALAAAIAAALFAGIAFLNRGPAWKVVRTAGTGIVTLGEDLVPIGDSPRITRLLRAGERVRVPEGAEMDILCEGNLMVQLTPGTEMTVPAAPGRWFARAVQARFVAGQARIATGPRFRGARLSIGTAEARMEVTGTTIAVIRNPDGTCLCVFEGTVSIGEGRREPERVSAGIRKTIYRDGRPPLVEPLTGMESSKLTMFRDQSRPVLEGSGR